MLNIPCSIDPILANNGSFVDLIHS
jgi:hypothetical protein